MLAGLLFVLSAAVNAQNARVVVTEVIERELNVGHRVVGSVVPIRQSSVGTAVDGRVVEFLVDQGDSVKAQQPVARLRTGTLEIELKATKAELKLRQEELKELQNGSRPEEISEAKARMLAARAVKSNSTTRLKRLEQLLERKAINDNDVDDARERSEAADQTLVALESAFQRIEAGPRAEQIAQAMARVDLQQTQVELIEDRIKKYTIYAPFDGYVTAEHTEVGEWVSKGDPIVDVIALDHVEVVCNVPAEHAVRLVPGGEIRVEFQELPGEVFTGTVARIVPTADSRTRTFPIRLHLKNRFHDKRPTLLAGMLARVILPTGDRTVMPLVPKDALVLNGSRRFVFIVDNAASGKMTAKTRPVVLGVADGGLIQVEGDLKPGDLVVVRGNERLKNGQEVTIQVAESSDSSTAD